MEYDEHFTHGIPDGPRGDNNEEVTIPMTSVSAGHRQTLTARRLMRFWCVYLDQFYVFSP